VGEFRQPAHGLVLYKAKQNGRNRMEATVLFAARRDVAGQPI